MNKRIAKKKNDQMRCQFIADKIGTIQRGVWSVYFNRYPKDYAKVRRLLTLSQLEIIRKDVKAGYVNPSFKKDSAEREIGFLRNGDFTLYGIAKSKKLFKTGSDVTQAVHLSLRDIPAKGSLCLLGED